MPDNPYSVKNPLNPLPPAFSDKPPGQAPFVEEMPVLLLPKGIIQPSVTHAELAAHLGVPEHYLEYLKDFTTEWAQQNSIVPGMRSPMPIRLRGKLEENNIFNLYDACVFTAEQIQSIDGLGKNSFNEFENFVRAGLGFVWNDTRDELPHNKIVNCQATPEEVRRNISEGRLLAAERRVVHYQQTSTEINNTLIPPKKQAYTWQKGKKPA